MCKYEHSLAKIETSYIVVDNVDTILLFLSSFGQFFVSGPKGS